MLWGLFVGLVMGLGWVAYVRAVQVVPVSTAGVLYMTYPVFTLVIAWALFRDTPSWRAIVSALMIVGAAAMVTTPGAVEAQHIPALILSLAAPAGFGLGISVLVHRMGPISVFARIGIVSIGSILGLLPLVLASDAAALFPAEPSGWWMVVGIGLATALVPQVIYTFCSPLVGTARTATAGSIELPVMFAVGWLAFGEALTPPQLLACAIVVTAIVITPAKRARSIAAEG
ncbi:MAG: DMT family transporter [Paracoccaceae bacterium]